MAQTDEDVGACVAEKLAAAPLVLFLLHCLRRPCRRRRCCRRRRHCLCRGHIQLTSSVLFIPKWFSTKQDKTRKRRLRRRVSVYINARLSPPPPFCPDLFYPGEYLLGV